LGDEGGVDEVVVVDTEVVDTEVGTEVVVAMEVVTDPEVPDGDSWPHAIPITRGAKRRKRFTARA
jgi:hypothetical protein